MYFHYTLLGGVLALGGTIVWTGSWALLVWMVYMLALYTIQLDAPRRFPESVARHVFGANVIAQWASCVAIAMLSQSAGALMFAVGMTTNILVIFANGGRMPILGEEWNNVCYYDADESTRLVWLCDHFQTTRTARHRWVISPGDALECIGIWVFAAEILLAA